MTLMWILSLHQRQRLVERLLECNHMNDDAARTAVLAQLPSWLQNAIELAGNRKVQVSNIVSTCLNYEWGLELLIDALRFFETNSEPMREVYRTLESIRPQPVSLNQLANLRDVLRVDLGDDDLKKLYVSVVPVDMPLPVNYKDRGLFYCMLDTLAVSLHPSRPIIKFIEALVQDVEGTHSRQSVLDWLSDTKQQLGYQTENSQLSADAGSGDQPYPAPLYLLIALHPVTESPGYYDVRAWIWGNRRKQGIFEAERWDVDKCLGQLIQLLLNEISGDIEDAGNAPIIEFFLTQELIGGTIDQNILEEDEPIGYQYCVVVRSYERAFEPSFSPLYRAYWKNRWKELLHAQSSHYCMVDRVDDRRSVRDKMNLFGCLALGCALQPNSELYNYLIATMLRAGTPIALWPRERVEVESDLPNAIEIIVSKGALTILPHLVWEQRRKAWVNRSNLLGKHLTLFWDDPSRVPASLTPKAPAAPGALP